MSKAIENLLAQLSSKIDGNYGEDFLQTWDKNDNAISATITTAQILKQFNQNNLSAKAFDSGLAISIFKDQSTRTRYSFNSAANLLGLLPVELDLGKSQVTHGETLYETINMISFLTRTIGVRDDVYLGEGAQYIQEVAKAVADGFCKKVLHYRPSVINLQSDIDHPTQSMSDLVHLAEHFGGLEKVKGKKNSYELGVFP